MESSGGTGKSATKVPTPKSEAFGLVVAAINATLDRDHEAFLCGGTVRDLLDGLDPKDLDGVVTPAVLPVLVDGLLPAIEKEALKLGMTIRAKENQVITLSTGSVQGSKLFRLSIKVRAKDQSEEIRLSLDFRELNFPSLGATPSIADLLKADVETRDFTINSMYCSTRDFRLIDLKKGSVS